MTWEIRYLALRLKGVASHLSAVTLTSGSYLFGRDPEEGHFYPRNHFDPSMLEQIMQRKGHQVDTRRTPLYGGGVNQPGINELIHEYRGVTYRQPPSRLLVEPVKDTPPKPLSLLNQATHVCRLFRRSDGLMAFATVQRKNLAHLSHLIS